MIIQLMFDIKDDMGLKSITFQYNDTPLPENSETLKSLAITILKSLKLNRDSVMVQDLLNELDIKLPGK